MEMCVILNAGSGKSRITKKVKAIKDAFAHFGYDIKIELLIPGITAEEKVQQVIKDGYEIVIAAGGDGTISSVANALLETNAILGIIPAGTLNHFAKDLNIPSSLHEAVKIILEGKTKAIDVCSVNDRVFINNSGIGIYPKIVRKREALQKRIKNKWVAFSMAAKEVWRGYPFLKIKVISKEKTFSCVTPFLLIGNNEYTMEGLGIGKRESLNQHAMSVYVAKHAQKRGILKFFLLAFISKLIEHKDFEFFTTQELTIESPKEFLFVSVDGEAIALPTPLHYKIHPQALKILVGK